MFAVSCFIFLYKQQFMVSFIVFQQKYVNSKYAEFFYSETLKTLAQLCLELHLETFVYS